MCAYVCACALCVCVHQADSPTAILPIVFVCVTVLCVRAHTHAGNGIKRGGKPAVHKCIFPTLPPYDISALYFSLLSDICDTDTSPNPILTRKAMKKVMSVHMKRFLYFYDNELRIIIDMLLLNHT